MKQSYKKYILALLLFGSNGIVASFISLNSREIVFTRTLIGSVFLLAVLFFSGEKLQFWKNKRHFAFTILSGFALGAGWMFLYEAYTQIGVSIATLAYYLGPVLVIAASPVIFRESMSPAKIFGVAAAVIGMVLLNGGAMLQSGFSRGALLGLLSALMYALMVIFSKKATSIRGLENAACQLCASFIIVAAFTLIKQGGRISFPAQSLLPILLLGIVNTGIGCYLYFSSFRKLRVQSVAVLGYLEPLSALFLSALVLRERLTGVQIFGAVLILGGAVFCECFRAKTRLKP